MAEAYSTLQIMFLIVIGLVVLITLHEFGVIGRAKARFAEHNAPRKNKPIWYHPEYGELEISGGVQMGDMDLPITTQFGDTPLPIPAEAYKNLYPLHPRKLPFGDPAGNKWIYISKDYPFSDVSRAMAAGYKRRDEELLMENEFLREQNKRMHGEFDEKVRQQADLIGDVRKKTATYIPPEQFKKMEKQGGVE